jgi:hypothetical protein
MDGLEFVIPSSSAPMFIPPGLHATQSAAYAAEALPKAAKALS